MTKLLLVVTALLCSIAALAQVQPTAPAQGNLDGNLFANGYGGWSVPQGNSGTFSWSSNTFCTANRGGTTFAAFTVGTPIQIIDQITPAHNEIVTVTSVDTTSNQCSIGTTVPVYQHTQFNLQSATAGLQEALNANLETSVATTVHLTADWYRLGGTTSMVTVTAKGTSMLGIVDDTTTPSNWYAWNGTHYVLIQIGSGGNITLTTVGSSGPATLSTDNPPVLNIPNYAVSSAGQLGTRQGDAVANNGNNTQPLDQDLYYGQLPNTQAGNNGLTVQQAATAANAHNGSFVIQPGVGRTPFTNPGNNRALDLRSDVPATARSVTEDGAVCDTGQYYGTLVSGSTALTVQDTTLSAAFVGKSIVAVGVTSGGTVTQFESVIASVTDSLHAVLTTPSPFNQATAHEINIGHDDTAAITKTMTTVGSGGTFVIPAGTCMTHTQVLAGQSPIGLGIQSTLVMMPGEDLFQAPDPSLTSGVNQGAAHIHDFTVDFDSRIDATQPWQKVNDSGTTAVPAVYRPVATLSGVSADPLAPGWMVGASNGVANITATSAVMCVPSSETAPAVGQTVIFPYLASIYTGTVSSTAGSCSGGATPRTLSSSLPAGSTNAQAEWFAGSSVQNLHTSITSGSCPTSITLSNNIDPVAGWESNVPPFGLIQIDGEQFSYFNKTNAGNHSPLNTLYGIQCGQNGTTRANHTGGSPGATVFPLNRFKPAYPWPVTPTLNSNDTTPAATAGYYPGWNVGNNAFAFPMASGVNSGVGAWNANAKIENLSFFAWPNDINGVAWHEVNNTGLIYNVLPNYAATFSNLYGLYSFFGITDGAPGLENHAWETTGPTADGTHYDGITLYAANPVILSMGNQNTFANFNVYSQEGTTSGSTLGADTCYYFTHLTDDQTGGFIAALTLDHFKNMYCEPEGGAHATSMPEWEFDTYNSEIEDQHMGGGGEVYIGGAQQHWFGGNFNNAIATPVVAFGSQNTTMRVTNLGAEPKGNVYSANSLINYSWGNDFSGTTAQIFATGTGPWGGIQVGGRAAIPNQNGETFFSGNTTAPFTSLEGGLITPEEFNANFAFESQAMNVGYTFDDTAPVTRSYTACNVGNNTNFNYCFTSAFNQNQISVGPGQRIANGKYTMYLSAKDVTAATNSWTMQVGTSCGGVIGTYVVPLTNAWPTTAAGVFTTPIDFTGDTAAGCKLALILRGATTADQIQINYLAFAPVAEQFNAQTINVTNINTPGGSTGGTPTGCMQSPVVGISGGYECPIKGFLIALTANQGSSDATATVSTTAGLSASGCFFMDTEYECYANVVDGTHLGGLTRGQYLTTAASHNSGANLVAVPLVLGSLQELPTAIVAYGGGGAPDLFALNNSFPQNHSNASVFSINSGSNELWVNTLGGIYQQSNSTSNQFGNTYFGLALPFQPPISQSGKVLQTDIPNTIYQPQTLGGGHAGTLNVIATPNIGAPGLQGALPSGSTTTSWVCSGTDFDGNLIPGATTTVTAAATWAYPQGISVGCPWAAGVNTYQIYRTAGGGSQGLIASGAGPGFWTSDFGGTTSGGTPPVSNDSNPQISVAGTGTPCITMGAPGATTQICSGTGAPTSTCGTQPVGSGSLWMRTDGATSTSLYSCASTTWTAVTIP